MLDSAWILISILILIILLGIVAIISFKRKGKQKEADYQTFFVIGVIWTIFGAIFHESVFFFLPIGIVFMILGLVNKDKWKKNHRTWKQLSKSERMLKIIANIILGIGVLAGLIFYWISLR
ncbi:MAG: hypothetical protein OQK82_00580 [Candidatus Pacearchaeota archaeon]|nr:hypothetical protein [Candidatus Pacearchaeota archaeon]